VLLEIAPSLLQIRTPLAVARRQYLM